MSFLSELAGVNQPGRIDDQAANRQRVIIKEACAVIDSHPQWRDRYRDLVEKFDKTSGGSTPALLRDARRIANTFLVMKNQEDHLRAIGEATVMNALGPLAPTVMDLVRVFFPNMIINLVGEVQSIPTPNSAILTVKPKYTNSGGGVLAGQEVFRNPTDGTYSSDQTSSSIGTGNNTTVTFAVTLSSTPVRPGTFSLQVGGLTVAQDNGNGGIVGPTISSGTVNYATGALAVTFSAPPANGNPIEATYRFDYEQNPNAMPGMDIGLNLTPVNAKPHFNKVVWSVAAALAAQAQYALDIESAIGDLSTQFIRKERDWAAVKLLAAAATHYEDLDFNCAVPNSSVITKKAHWQDWGIKLAQADVTIFNKSQRGNVSWVLAGINACNVIRMQANFVPEPRIVPIGSHKIGSLDNAVDVIQEASLDPDLFIVGFRGMQLGDAALICAEWVPIFLTPVWQAPTLQGQQGILSMYDIIMNNADYLVYGRMLDYNA